MSGFGRLRTTNSPSRPRPGIARRSLSATVGPGAETRLPALCMERRNICALAGAVDLYPLSEVQEGDCGPLWSERDRGNGARHRRKARWVNVALMGKSTAKGELWFRFAIIGRNGRQ